MSVLTRILLLTLLAVGHLTAVHAQESLPNDPAPANTTSDQSSPADRIVDGRPTLYSIKRMAHPLSWLEVALEPGFRSGESGRIHSLLSRKPAPHFKIGAGSIGTGSGFGPEVTLMDEDFLGRGIHVEIPLLYTYSQYQAYQFKASVPLTSRFAANGLSFDLGAGYVSRARDDFFGIGNDSGRDDERQVRWVTRRASAGVSANL